MIHADTIRKLPLEQRVALLQDMPAMDAAALYYDWKFWRRPEQIPPIAFALVLFWLICAGRGYGKTRVGAQWVIEQAERDKRARIALLSGTPGDCREVMVEGESGILACSPPWFYPKYEPSKRRLTWPNGAIATTYSAANPDELRGPQHTKAWVDEIAGWRNQARAIVALDNLRLGLRLGDHPQGLITTTPKPIKVVRDLLKDDMVAVTYGSTYDNLANLAPSFAKTVLAKYEGTALGSQELYGKLLEDIQGALWRRTWIESNRLKSIDKSSIRRIVVGVDPAVTVNADSDETGIVVKAIDYQDPPHIYTLADLSLSASPSEWATAAVKAFKDWRADRVVVETNQGGDMVEATLRTVDPNVPITRVHVKDGKRTRAEPIAAFAEQGREHHVGIFEHLEDQKCTWVPGVGDSPDRLDADVLASTDLKDNSYIAAGPGTGTERESTYVGY